MPKKSKPQIFINKLINKNINIKEMIKYYRYDIIYNNEIIAIILCEDRNDCIFLIFDVKNYLMGFNVEYDIFGYYNTYECEQRKECLDYIEKEINKYKNTNQK